ncbi:sialidase family protein [Jiangella anatolica]|uniref:exo-alpha-sialidase n=1 Tax=Jiangella anatolica TaxID=2670374 RepID=A0A2W2BJ64_9ACTN|nr:sialidase family protein [Jiangella anatolica]PZF80348.1 hypothetical protein C1I92_26515 [Jiangella anatolica]
MPGRTRHRLTNVVSGLAGFGAAVALLASNAGPGPAGADPVADVPTGAVNPLPAGDGPDPDAYAVGIGPEWNVVNWGPGPRAAVPSAFAMDTVADGVTEQKVFVSSQANDDVAGADSITNMSVSLDSAVSFLTTTREAPVGAHNMLRLDDGSLISVEFIPEWTDATQTAVNLKVWRSEDQGETWEPTLAPFTPPPGKVLGPMNRGLRVHREPLLLPDGTIILPAYTRYQGEIASSIVLQSTDGGASWTQRGQIPATAPGTNEVGWSWTSDGRLVAALRTAETPPRLRVTFSDDSGATWTPAQPLLGPDGEQVQGIYPGLVLQPNGVLLLSTGRPDDRVYVSRDGTGRTWDEERLVLQRYPSETGNGRFDGSSGNTTVVNVDADRTVYIGDYCHVWGCKAYHEQYGVFAAYVHAVTPGTGKIDLETKLRTGTATVTGTFARPDRTFPEQRPEGAFDGSSRAHSAAVLQARRGAPSMTVELDQEYSLHRIGLMLGAGQPLDATVQLSADGVTWSAPVVTADGARDHAMRYTEFEPQRAQFVRVTGAAGVTTPVTELELYAAGVDTFENDPLYGIPRGFVDAKNTTVTDQELGGFDSGSSLRLFDKFLDDNAVASTVTPERDRQVTSFRFATNDFRGPFTFAVDGRSGDDAAQPWRFRLVPGTTAQPAQTLEVFDGSAWTALGRLSAPIAVNAWAPITVDTSTSAATVTIGGDTFSTTATAESATALAGLTVTTGDPIAYGMTFFVDDLSIR